MDSELYCEKLEKFFKHIQEYNRSKNEQSKFDLISKIDKMKQINSIYKNHILYQQQQMQKLKEIKILNALQTQKLQKNQKIIQDALTNLIEVRNETNKNTKHINLQQNIKPHELLCYALEISPSLQAPKQFNHEDDYQNIMRPPFPNEYQVQVSTLNFIHKEHVGRCRDPIIQLVNVTTAKELPNEKKIVSNTRAELRLSTIDDSYISYTVDGSFPSAFIGYNNRDPGNNEPQPLITTITGSCNLKIIAFKPKFLESYIVERDILIESEKEYQIGQESMRPQFQLGFKRNETICLSEDTPFTPGRYLQTPQQTPQYTPQRDYKEEEQFKLR